MNKSDRHTAIRAARARIREIGEDPARVSAKDGWSALEYLAESAPDTVAAMWCRQADDAAQGMFFREWKKQL